MSHYYMPRGNVKDTKASLMLFLIIGVLVLGFLVWTLARPESHIVTFIVPAAATVAVDGEPLRPDDSIVAAEERAFLAQLKEGAHSVTLVDPTVGTVQRTVEVTTVQVFRWVDGDFESF